MAFFDESSSVVEPVSPAHLDYITKDTRVHFVEPYKLDYPEGLYALIETFFDGIRTLPVLIRQISYTHGHIYVNFEMLKQRGELKVWQHIGYLQERVGFTCASCGGMARRQVYKSVLRVVCSICAAKDVPAKVEGTGTWLDKL